MKQLTRKEAIEFGESKKYKSMTCVEIAKFQIQQDKMCMPFAVFHEAIEKTVGHPVWTHELGNREYLRALTKEILSK